MTMGSSTELSASSTLQMGQIEYVGILCIRLVEGRDLKKKDRLTGKADPYVVFRLGGREVRSTVQKRTLNPIWNEQFQLPVPSLNDMLELGVFDADLVGEDEAMGDPLSARGAPLSRSVWCSPRFAVVPGGRSRTTALDLELMHEARAAAADASFIDLRG